MLSRLPSFQSLAKNPLVKSLDVMFTYLWLWKETAHWTVRLQLWDDDIESLLQLKIR